MTADNRDVMGVTELAEYLGRDRRTIHRWVKRGYIRGYRDGLDPLSPIKVERAEAERVKRLLDAGLPL